MQDTTTHASRLALRLAWLSKDVGLWIPFSYSISFSRPRLFPSCQDKETDKKLFAVVIPMRNVNPGPRCAKSQSL